jgi:hypothetical protein
MPQSFTPAEANRTLPLVKRIVSDILSKGRELQQLAPDQHKQEVGDRLWELQNQLRDHMQELADIGCSYKDFGFKLGLVDFPGEIDHEPALLCWRSDEEAVTHYHGYTDGYAGRREIPVELLEGA